MHFRAGQRGEGRAARNTFLENFVTFVTCLLPVFWEIGNTKNFSGQSAETLVLLDILYN
ncbi:hypothetical protein DSECCO2_439070 [anaerobic digester metagenome]